MIRATATSTSVVLALELLGGVTTAAPVTIHWASYTVNASFENTLKSLVAGFEKLHPDIHVELDYGAAGAWDKIQVAYTAGAAPDVALLNFDWLPTGIKAGMFDDLTPYMQRDHVEAKDYIPIALSSWSSGGKLYAAPLYAGGEAQVFNKALFNAAGLAYPDASWNWDTLVAASKKMTIDNNGDGQADQMGFAAWLNIYTGIASFVRENGGEVLNADRTAPLLEEPKALEALNFISELINQDHVVPTSADVKRGITFAAGKVGLATIGSWYAASLRDTYTSLDWDFAEPIAGPTGIRNLQVGSNAWGILSTSKHKEEAWQFVKYLISEAGQSAWASNGIPALRSVAVSPKTLSLWPREHFRDYVQWTASYGHDYYGTVDWGAWTAAANKALAPVWTGQRSPKEGAQRADQAIAAVFAKRKS